jgi:hypothetical protein
MAVSLGRLALGKQRSSNGGAFPRLSPVFSYSFRRFPGGLMVRSIIPAGADATAAR